MSANENLWHRKLARLTAEKPFDCENEMNFSLVWMKQLFQCYSLSFFKNDFNPSFLPLVPQ